MKQKIFFIFLLFLIYIKNFAEKNTLNLFI